MASRIIRETRTVRIPIHRRDREEHQLPNGGSSISFTSVVDHYEDVDVELEIDIDALFSSVGRRAATNRTGKAVEDQGSVKARRISTGRRIAS